LKVADTALSNENIHVIVEGDDDQVQTDADGTISIPTEDGGVVVHLNPPRADQGEIDDPAKFYENIVSRLGEGELMTIANSLHEAIQADDESRSEWLANRAAGMDLLGLKMDDPRNSDGASAVDGQSIVTNPLLLDGVLRGWANAQAELLPAEGPCKIADYSDLPSQQKDELGEALQRDMNYYLTTVATEFGPETSHMLLWGCYFGGSGFKKVYTHPLKKRPYSEAVSPENLIVSDATKDFDACERITHVISMRQTVMKRYQIKGIYREIALAPPTPTSNQVSEEIAQTQGVASNKQRPEDMPYTLWETQCELDLDTFAPAQFKGKGVPLPYLVTMDKDSMTILSIRRDWKPEDEDCARKKMYVKYPYVPGPGFYGTGLVNILGNASAAMTAAWRMCLDAGMFANFPAFLIDKLAGRQNTSNFRAGPGEGIPIETGGRDIDKVVTKLPYHEAGQGLMTLMDKITEQSKAVGGAPDIPIGEGVQNVPVGTMLAHIEQATKVMAAAHKGQHRALDEELSLYADLFRENPEAFWKGNKRAKGYWSVQKLIQALDERTLVPKSDPNVPSHIHRVMKAVALVELAGTPLGKLMDMHEVLRRVLGAMREEIAGLILPKDPNPPPPDADTLAAIAKGKEADAKMKATEVNAAENAQKPVLEQIKSEGSIKGKTIDLAKALITHEGDRQDAAHQRQMDIAGLASDANQQALDATKVTDNAMKTRADLANKDREHGLASAQAAHKMTLESRQHGLAEQQAQHAMAKDSADHGLARAELGHQVGMDTNKIGIQQQQADVAKHMALNPPKPADGGKKPKKK